MRVRSNVSKIVVSRESCPCYLVLPKERSEIENLQDKIQTVQLNVNFSFFLNELFTISIPHIILKI